MWIPLLLVVAGCALGVAGIALIYPPAAFIVGGALLVAAGLQVDFEPLNRGGGRATR